MISYFSDIAENCYEQAAIAQSVVRNIGSVEVTGSIPVSSFFCCPNSILSLIFYDLNTFLTHLLVIVIYR